MVKKAAVKATPTPRKELFLILNKTMKHAPRNMTIVVTINTVRPIFPVLTQIYTYSESGGT